MNDLTLCGSCSQPLKPEASVRLWDGREYCHPCVEQASPQLLGYALAHDVLEEAMPYNRNAVIWRGILWRIILGTAFFLPLSALAAHDEQVPWFGVALVICILCAIVAAIYVPLDLWMAKRGMSKVSVSDGRLTVCRPRLPKTLRQITFPLKECRWRVGRLGQDRFLQDSLTFSRRAIILVYTVPVPHFRHRFKTACRFSKKMREILVYFLSAPVLGSRFRIRTACGFSKEMRRIWEGFLRLASIAETPRWRVAPLVHRLGGRK